MQRLKDVETSDRDRYVSRLRDRDRWKRVAGPIGALVAYLHDLKIEASNLYEWRHQEEVVHPFRQACSLQAVAFLRRVAVKARLMRISLQDNAQDLLHGIDWTVPRKILNKCLTIGPAMFGKSIGHHPL